MKIYKAILFTLLLVAFEIVFSFLFHFLAVKAGDSESILQFTLISMILTKLAAYLIMLLVVFKIGIQSSVITNRLKEIHWQTFVFVLIAGIGFKLFSKPFHDISLLLGFNPQIELNDALPPSITIVYHIIRVVILAPVLEEIFFRKVLFNGLLKKYSFMLSALVSSILFALIHIPEWLNLFPSFIFGVVCCWIYYKTKSIIYPIAIHLIGNLFGVFYNYQTVAVQQIMQISWVYWSLFIVGTGLLILGIRKIANSRLQVKLS